MGRISEDWNKACDMREKMMASSNGGRKVRLPEDGDVKSGEMCWKEETKVVERLGSEEGSKTSKRARYLRAAWSALKNNDIFGSWLGLYFTRSVPPSLVAASYGYCGKSRLALLGEHMLCSLCYAVISSNLTSRIWEGRNTSHRLGKAA